MQSPTASGCRKPKKDWPEDETTATLEGSISRLDEVRRKLRSEVAVIQGLTVQCSRRDRSPQTDDLFQRVRDNLSEVSLAAIKGATGVGQHIDSSLVQQESSMRRTSTTTPKVHEKPCLRKSVLQRLKVLTSK